MFGAIVNMLKRIIFRMKLQAMDEQWSMRFGYCFEMYPPSFYYLHTPEEQEAIIRRDVEAINKMIDQL
ncbi:MAG: hypothetical protein J6C01_11075 [Lachnospiraceae bacterium]|nr:hypothetical protein [Lachnospiraceae bacterium]